ncbi:MAG TPA: DUF4142 domain-containing protein [Vicinamibacterales bacterium]
MKTMKTKTMKRDDVAPRMRHGLLAGVLAVSLGVAPALAQQPPPPSQPPTQGQTDRPGTRDLPAPRADRSQTAGQLSAADRKFVTRAAAGNHAEVQLAQLAQQKSQRQEVKDLARAIEQDHTKANQELKRIAQDNNVDLETKLTAEHQQLRKKLEGLEGTTFDRAYTQAMVQEHQKDIKAYQQAQNKVANDDLKQYITSTLPSLQKHLEHAKQAEQSGRQSN